MDSLDSKIKLHLGCGEKYLEGYINVDFPSSEHNVMEVKADVYQDFRTLPYEENSVDEIRSHQVFEHYTRVEALELLAQWRKWLKPDGILIIETPDFESSIRAYLHSFRRRRKWDLGRHIFGTQEADWAYHLDFWDKAKFKFVLKKFGFKSIKARVFTNSLAKRYPKIPFLNILGDFLPDAMYRKYGGNKLPDIVAVAKKDGSVKIHEEVVIREILSETLGIHYDYKMIEALLKTSKNHK